MTYENKNNDELNEEDLWQMQKQCGHGKKVESFWIYGGVRQETLFPIQLNMIMDETVSVTED